jgi:hypothetical protein
MRTLLTILLLLFSAPAFATEIDFSQILTSLDGQAVPNCPAGNCNNPPPLTLGDAVVLALTVNLPDDKNTTSDEKFKRYVLAQKIYGHSKVDLKAEDISKIKEAIGKAYGPVVLGRAWQLLDPEH